MDSSTDSAAFYTVGSRGNLISWSNVCLPAEEWLRGKRWKSKKEQKELKVIWPKYIYIYIKEEWGRKKLRTETKLTLKMKVSDCSEIHQESKDKGKKKIQNWRAKPRRFPESSSARRTHPASMSALPQPFNWFNSPKWSLSGSLGSFFPLSCHIWDARLSLLHSKSV